MFLLRSTGEYLVVLLIATTCGLVGGLVFELLQTRKRGTGRLELPGRVGTSRFFDLGFLASLIVGGVAAVAVLYVFPPALELKVTGADGHTTTSTQYDLIKLVAISLISGSAGAGIMTGLQGRVLSAVNAQQVINTTATAKSALKAMASRAAAEVKTSLAEEVSVRTARHSGAATIDGAVADRVAARVQGRLDQHAEELTQLIESGSQPVTSDQAG